MTREQSALILLLGCALADESVDDAALAGVDMDGLYRLASRHMVSAMAGLALEKTAIAAEEEGKRWAHAVSVGRYRRIALDRERAELLRFLEHEGIWYMPLKGILLQGLYPQFGMREMADNDILYDVRGQRKVCEYMKSRGYEAVSIRLEVHDIYHKPPLYNFEMHTRLFEESFDGAVVDYYADFKRLLQKDADNGFGYHMSDEDFYLYFIAHAYRHYAREGTGLRTLTDCSVYWKAKGQSLDLAYIRRELERMGIRDFEETLRGLSRALFDRPAMGRELHLTESESRMLSYVLSSGSFGTMEQKVENSLRGLQPEGGAIRAGTKGKYLLRRLFPPWRRMLRYNRFVQKHPWSLPFVYVYRIFKCVGPMWRQILSEIRMVRRARGGEAGKHGD